MSFERYEFAREIDTSRRVREHEIFMSFFDDRGAETFQEWWEKEGHTLYSEYFKKKALADGIKEENLHLFMQK